MNKVTEKLKTVFGINKAGSAKTAAVHKSAKEHAVHSEKTVEELLAPLPARFKNRLLSMMGGEPQLGNDGNLHPIDKLTGISAPQGRWLHDFCVSTSAHATLEIGMAYGYSTLFFLAALAKNGDGRHISIDPLQSTHWHGIGLGHARALASGTEQDASFSMIEDRSDRAAADLIRSGAAFDVIFIDGNHRFDDVLVDFYLYAPLCKIGGYIVLDDMWMNSVRTVVEFVRTNRTDFTEIRTDQWNISVFKRVANDARKWSHFREFKVFPSAD